MSTNPIGPLQQQSPTTSNPRVIEVLTKTDAGTIDGTPDKRLFWSIISDYDLKTGLCELIDNAVDAWMKRSPRGQLDIQITLESDRQLISITDNSGGVAEENLQNLIAPGASQNDPDAESIGIFGVGSKRAVVALAENAVIKTRSGDGPSYEIDITKEWLESPDWDIPHYRIPEIPANQTTIELSALRIVVTEDDIEDLKTHIAETYSWFLAIDDFNVSVNNGPISPIEFDNWAYPEGFHPKQILFQYAPRDHSQVSIDITGGLILDRDPALENYGVYFYCNNRLIAKEKKSREVGYYITSEAGVPHPDASLCRVIVRLHGGAKLMPWNSSKRDINFNHPIFKTIRPSLIPLVAHFSSLSRRLKDSWEEKVFPFAEGNVDHAEPEAPEKGSRLILPPLPKVRKPASQKLKSANKEVLENAPWTLGLLESVSALDLLQKQKLETRNRIALILLDSNFEIALKEFVVHRTDIFPPQTYDDAKIKEIFGQRWKVVREVKNAINLPQKLIDKANHYYGLRNKIIHERATIQITDHDVAVYRQVVEELLTRLFDLQF